MKECCKIIGEHLAMSRARDYGDTLYAEYIEGYTMVSRTGETERKKLLTRLITLSLHYLRHTCINTVS